MKKPDFHANLNSIENISDANIELLFNYIFAHSVQDYFFLHLYIHVPLVAAKRANRRKDKKDKKR